MAVEEVSPPAKEELKARLEQILGETISPLILLSQAAFQRDLPQLLLQHYHQWVAYSGDKRLGIAKSKTGLYQECLRCGLQPDQFVVRSIEPEVTAEIEVPLDV